MRKRKKQDAGLLDLAPRRARAPLPTKPAWQQEVDDLQNLPTDQFIEIMERKINASQISSFTSVNPLEGPKQSDQEQTPGVVGFSRRPWGRISKGDDLGDTIYSKEFNSSFSPTDDSKAASNISKMIMMEPQLNSTFSISRDESKQDLVGHQQQNKYVKRSRDQNNITVNQKMLQGVGALISSPRPNVGACVQDAARSKTVVRPSLQARQQRQTVKQEPGEFGLNASFEDFNREKDDGSCFQTTPSSMEKLKYIRKINPYNREQMKEQLKFDQMSGVIFHTTTDNLHVDKSLRRRFRKVDVNESRKERDAIKESGFERKVEENKRFMAKTLSKEKIESETSLGSTLQLSTGRLAQFRCEKKLETGTQRQKWENLMKRSMYLKKVATNSQDPAEQLFAEDSDMSDSERELFKMSRLELLTAVRQKTDEVLQFQNATNPQPPNTDRGNYIKVLQGAGGNDPAHQSEVQNVLPKSDKSEIFELLQTDDIHEILGTYRYQYNQGKFNKRMRSREDLNPQSNGPGGISSESMRKLENNQYFQKFIQEYDSNIRQSILGQSQACQSSITDQEDNTSPHANSPTNKQKNQQQTSSPLHKPGKNDDLDQESCGQLKYQTIDQDCFSLERPLEYRMQLYLNNQNKIRRKNPNLINSSSNSQFARQELRERTKYIKNLNASDLNGYSDQTERKGQMPQIKTRENYGLSGNQVSRIKQTNYGQWFLKPEEFNRKIKDLKSMGINGPKVTAN